MKTDSFAFAALCTLLAIVGLTGALMFAQNELSRQSCEQRWRVSGLQSSYGFFQGCLVKMPSGRWIPDKNVRDIDLDKGN